MQPGDQSMTIAGEQVAAAASFEVINPATGQPFASAPDCTTEQLDQAMAAAEAAYRGWRVDDSARRAALREAATALDAAASTLVPLLTAEQGKPLAEAATELATACAWLRYFADLEVEPQIVQDDERGLIEIIRRPFGVVAAITPWNYPIALAAWKLGPALRAGNTVVLKPSPFTPLSSLEVGRILAGVLPPGVLNVISGTGQLGPALTGHPLTRKISFTGSIATGKQVGAAAATGLKRVTLELGGNDPAIVLADADPQRIARSLFWGAFRNNGQTCFAIKRIYVEASRHDELVEALASRAAAARVGDGTQPRVQLGPVSNQPQLQRVQDLVTDAVAGGGRVAAGGSPIDRPGYFFEPTIISGVGDGVRLVDEEQFGPALPIISYRDLDATVQALNSSRYGLTASVWSSDPERAGQVARQLECGQVSVNKHAGAVRPDLPFGGHRSSGIGVENGPWGLASFTEPQVLALPARTAI